MALALPAERETDGLPRLLLVRARLFPLESLAARVCTCGVPEQLILTGRWSRRSIDPALPIGIG